MKAGNFLVSLMLENGIIEQDEIEVYGFGVQLLLETLFSFAVFFIIAALLGILWEFIVFMAAFALLRQYAGGFHAKTFLRCLFISCIIVSLLYPPLKFTGDGTAFICIGSVVSLPVIAVLSPVDSVYKPIAEDERKKYRKRLIILLTVEVAAVIVTVFCFDHIYAVCIVYAWCVLALSLAVGRISNKRLGR